jgi:hypothetical protein
VHLTNSRVKRYNPDTNTYYYVTDIEYKADGNSLWKGTLYTKAGQKEHVIKTGDGLPPRVHKTRTQQVTLYEPAELAGPLPKGWIEP